MCLRHLLKLAVRVKVELPDMVNRRSLGRIDKSCADALGVLLTILAREDEEERWQKTLLLQESNCRVHLMYEGCQAATVLYDGIVIAAGTTRPNKLLMILLFLLLACEPL